MCSLRDAVEELDALGVAVYGISLDPVRSQARFAGEQELSFQLLSDPDASASTKYGVLAEGGRYASRVTFLIDPKGVLRHVEREVKVDSHGADLAALVRRLQDV